MSTNINGNLVAQTVSCDELQSSGAIQCGTNAATCGAVVCDHATSSGSIVCGSITASGSLVCDGIGNAGTLSSTGAATVGALSCSSLVSNGTMTCGSNAATCGALNCASITPSGGNILYVNASHLIMSINSQLVMSRDSMDISAPAIDYRNIHEYGIYSDSTGIAGRGNTLDFKYRDYNSGSVRTGTVLSLGPAGTVGINSSYDSQSLKVYGNLGIKVGMLDVVDYSTSSITMARFLNSSMSSGSHGAIELGNREFNGRNSLLIYESRGSSGYCSLGTWDANNVINWNHLNSVGINAAPSNSETLYVNGNVKATNITNVDLLSTGNVTCVHGSSGAGFYSPPIAAGYTTLPGLVELKNEETSTECECGILFNNVRLNKERKWRLGVHGNTGAFVIRDDTAGLDKYKIYAGGSSVSALSVVNAIQASDVSAFLAHPDYASQGMFAYWNLTGTGMSHIINRKGLGSGGFSFSEYIDSSNSYVKCFTLNNGLTKMNTFVDLVNASSSVIVISFRINQGYRNGCYRITIMCKDNGLSDTIYGACNCYYFGNGPYAYFPQIVIENIGTPHNVTFSNTHDSVYWYLRYNLGSSSGTNLVIYRTMELMPYGGIGY